MRTGTFHPTARALSTRKAKILLGGVEDPSLGVHRTILWGDTELIIYDPQLSQGKKKKDNEERNPIFALPGARFEIPFPLLRVRGEPVSTAEVEAMFFCLHSLSRAQMFACSKIPLLCK